MLKIIVFIDTYLICKTRYSKMVQMCIFYGEFENEKKKGQKFFDLPEQEFEPQIFSNFPAQDLNFHVKWGAWDQIKTSF